MKNIKMKIGVSVFILIIAVFIGVELNPNKKTVEKIPYTEFVSKLNNKEIESVVISESPKMNFILKDNDIIYETDNPRNLELKELLLLQDVSVAESSYVSGLSILQTITSILFFVVIFYFVYKTMNKNTAKTPMAMEIEKHDKKEIAFDDIAGNEEAKESVKDIVDFIKNAEKYSKYGARMPRGVIFYGRPGTGKTLMAKAIAGEAGVPFYSVSGSDFVQMYVGVGASRIRDLFAKARQAEKAVIFIDEIDALGKKRSNAAIAGNEERDQTLNALLTEMSGFNSTEGIVVIAATNRLDTLDEALLRPGRFDRQVEIGLPDLSARKSILELYMKGKPMNKEVTAEDIAKQTVYFSGAMLENLLNEAAIHAAKNESEYINKDDIDKAYYTVIAGAEKKDRSNVLALDRKITAYHEAGHGLLAKLVLPENTVSKITIIPSTKGIGGFCVNIPPDKMYYTKKELESKIIVDLAGRASEEIIFGNDYITTGASNDIEKATGLIKDYVMKYGMSEETGLLCAELFEQKDRSYVECSRHIERLYQEAKQLLLHNRDKLSCIATALLEKETLHEEDLDYILAQA